jgi:hypothetical protein
VLASVHTEALHADVDEVVEVVGDLAAHVVLGPVQVVQAHQVAVSHLMERKGIFSTVRRVIERLLQLSNQAPADCTVQIRQRARKGGGGKGWNVGKW